MHQHPSKYGTKPQKHATNNKKMLNRLGLDSSNDTLAKRANRFSGSGGGGSVGNKKSNNNNSTVLLDHDKYMGKRLIGGNNVTLDEADYEQMTVKGTSTTLEKEYLRLTAPPRAELVRPLFILKQHLVNLKREYYLPYDGDGGNGGGDGALDAKILAKRERTPKDQWNADESSRRPRSRRDYLWFCSQLKAVRQDCTVQRIQGAFAVDVYETHARIALQENDLNE
jgi:hypothetical protein